MSAPEPRDQRTRRKHVSAKGALTITAVSCILSIENNLKPFEDSISLPVLVGVVAFTALAFRYSAPIGSFLATLLVCVILLAIQAPWIASMIVVPLPLFFAVEAVSKVCSYRAACVCAVITVVLIGSAALWWWKVPTEFVFYYVGIAGMVLSGCVEVNHDRGSGGRHTTTAVSRDT